MSTTFDTIDDLDARKRELLLLRLKRTAKTVGTRAGPPALLRVGREQPLPLSFAQQRLWFIDQLDSAGGAAYHMPAALRLRGPLHRGALRAALDRIVARHEILRTSFTAADGGAVQTIGAADTGFALVERDLPQLPSAERDTLVQQIARDEAAAPFDLATGPLIRGQLLCVAADDHVLLITQHHIVTDGWSIGILIQELCALYAAFSQGLSDPLPPLAIQYADYAAWQRNWLQGEVLQSQIDYWKSHLSGAPALLTLPTDRARPPVQSFAGGQHEFVLGAALTGALRQLSRRHGATLFMTLMAGWAVVLARHSGQDDVVVGTPIANRQRSELEPLIGFFVNTLAIRVRLEESLSVAGLLGQVKASALGAYAHQDLPFERLVEVLQPPRSMGHSPIFQVTLALNNTPADNAVELAGLALSGLAQQDNSSHFDMTLGVTETGDTLLGNLSYASDLFDPGTIARMAEHLRAVLGAMVADETQSVDRLAFLSEEERHQVLASFNNSAAEAPTGSLIHAHFEAQVNRTPDAVAVTFGKRALSYRELNERANKVAHRLIGLGVQPDDRVALCLDRGVDLIVCLLGILKSGAAFLPLDPNHPAELLTQILSDGAPKVLLSESGLAHLQGESGMALLEPVQCGNEPTHNPAVPQLRGTHLAYVIYTSGSTGKPKGVMIEHRSVVNLWTALGRTVFADVDRAIAVAMNASVVFDASVKCWIQLLSGHRLVLVPAEVRADGRELLEFFATHRIDAFDCTPMQLDGLLHAGLGHAAGYQPSQVMIGGDAISAGSWERMRESASTAFFNVYGPTECTVDATVCRIGAQTTRPQIGRPIANVRIYILDRYLQLVPVGAEGEIFIAGAGVARGYLGRMDLTAERFLADPFVAGERMYKSGDLGRWLASGAIEYVGRNDFQVKIRGFRIELGEIENRLCQCSAIREAVVLAREDQPGDKRLVAYVTAIPGMTIQIGELRSELARSLAEYMVPSAFMVMEAWPLTANKKLDRKTLPAPDGSAVVTQAYVAPVGAAEMAIAGIWQELLHLDRVGRHDNFFVLGGHSLMAVQLISRVRERLGVELSLRALFGQPTLCDFAALAGQAERSTLPPIAVADRAQPLLLSFAQQRLWFIDQLDHAGSVAYHMPAALRLDGKLNLTALRAALDRIVARHEILRTTFADVDGVLQQCIAAPGQAFALAERDLRDALEAEREQQVRRIAEAEASQPFDLATGPLIRGQLLRLKDTEHVLLFTQHHIISDGWSIGILVQELSALYNAFSEGRADPLPALSAQYSDYAQWQRQWLQGEALKQQVAFWRTYLSGAPALLSLPADHPRPDIQDPAGGMVPLELSAALSARLRALSQRHGGTLFMTLLAAWGVLLGRLSGQQDVVIGTPVANRQRSEVESLIGFFVNTLALRVSMDDDPTVAELLARVKGNTLAAYEHQALPFEQVVEALQPARSMSHSPLFQVMLSLDNTPDSGGLKLNGLQLGNIELAQKTAQFDLSLSLIDSEDGIFGGIEYASSLFEPATIERFACYFGRLLESMVEDDQVKVSRLTYFDGAERAHVLYRLNATARYYPRDVLIHELFEQQVTRTPDAVAVVFEGRQLSYAELNSQANQLAHYLLKKGVQPDDRVAICVERSLDMIVGLLGILKAGGAYVPLDPAYPVDRLSYMLEHSEPVMLLGHRALLGRLEPIAVPVLALDESTATHGYPATNPLLAERGLCPANLAYVLYTSGSTGKPKGVMVEHRNVVNLIYHHIESNCFTAADRVLQFASYSFDNSINEIFPALTVGAMVVLRSEHLAIPDQAFSDFIREHGITVADLPTSFWSQWAYEVHHQRALPHAGLRLVVAGGEKAERQHLSNWFSGTHAGRGQWLNTYGPTEATVNATQIAYDGAADLNAEVPIGRPITNTRIYILDAHLQPVPVGVEGEIFIAGAGVARGYLGREDLTAERFLADPFVAGERMYKSGDLGRWLASGVIEYVGRNDFQVKVRGFRIELGEIESRLCQCSGVREAVVLAREDQPGDKRLVAYVTAVPGVTLEIGELRSELARGLAEYMVPSAFMVIDAWPLTPNKKLDRKALPAPDGSAVVMQAYVAPEGAAEMAIAGIWQELLRLDRVGRHDNFFVLGGHSLMAVQLISRVRERLGVELSLRALFGQPTLCDFAALAEQAERAMLPPIAVADRAQALLLSFAQQRLWFIDQLDHAASVAYHMPAALRLGGKLDRTALRAALDRIVARHEILRTTFADVDGVLQQCIAAPTRGFALSERDLRDAQQAEREQQVRRIAEAEVSRPFDLAAGPLIRGQLLRLGDTEHVLLITQHHIISDGWSIGILVQEFSALYNAFSQGHADPLPALSVQYADYAQWQRQWLEGEALTQQLSFWRTHLGGAPALLSLPTDHPRPEIQDSAGGMVPLALSAALSARLRALSQRHGGTLFMTLLAAWGVLLGRLCGQQDVVIGTPVANRQRSEVESLIGFFVNTLALRVSMDDDPTVAELLARVKGNTLAAYEHQALPFEQVVEALQPARSMSHSPLFQVMLSLDNTPDSGGLALNGLQIGQVELEQNTAQFDLSLSLIDSEDGIFGAIRYASSLFKPATIERFARYFGRLLEHMAEGDQLKVSGLTYFDGEERAHVLYGLNATAQDYPRDVLIHELFEQQVKRTPEAVAVVFEDRQLSYAELNSQANRLAHYLLAHGVQPDDRVAICVERSLDMVIGLLGILKAGGAYVPLDAEYPLDRLAWMLDDSGAKLVLTQTHLRTRLGMSAAQAVILDSEYFRDQLHGYGTHNPGRGHLGLGVGHMAYVIYTSGSTGKPKGVINQHSGVVNRLCWAQQDNRLQADDCVMQKTPFGFDVSVWEFFLPLMAGARLLIAQPGGHRNPEYLGALIAQRGVTMMHFVPSMLTPFLDAVAGQDCPSLRRVVCSGEALPYQAQQRFMASFPHCELHNLYGPTEAAIDVTAWRCVAYSHVGFVPIGRPIANTQMYILDAGGQPVPVGVVGELHIGGIGVARGYLNRPELTAKSFCHDPFSASPNARMYRTGDLGRWLDDGSIAYLGRNDFQVKIRGFRIELGEIETQLGLCANVRRAVVVAREDGADKRLVAYLQAGDKPPAVADLRQQLAVHLPDYMVPSAFVMVDDFPLSPNGKLDVKALPSPDRAAIVTQAYEAPVGEAETAIAAVWQDLLGLTQVGRKDNFFELGGHSLMAVTFLSRLNKLLSIDMPLRELFAHPTVERFAAAVQQRNLSNRYRHLAPVRTEGKEAPLFFIHPGEGEIGYVHALAPWLGADTPVYGLAALGLQAGEQPLRSVEQMAASYLREMKLVQPQGPYRIAGWSAGGTIAYEIAQQLLGVDEQVEFLGLIDTVSSYALPYDHSSQVEQRAQVPGDLASWVQALLTEGPAAAIDRTDLLALVREGQASGVFPQDVVPETVLRHLAVRHAIFCAMRDYVLHPVPLGVTLFAAAENASADAASGWHALLGDRLRLIPVAGNHYSMVEAPHAQALGAAIAAAVRQAPGQQQKGVNAHSARITIQSGRASVAPLFCIPGAGASVASFARLAMALDPAIPVHGMQPRGLCGLQAPHVDVPSAARAYLREIREVSPRGPYRLCGHSFGGWVAFEIARQLVADGERVEMLAVLDSEAPDDAPRPAPYTRVEVLERLISIYEMSIGKSLGITSEQLEGADYAGQLSLLLARLIAAGLMPKNTRLDTLRGIARVFAANLNTHYTPSGPYTGPLYLVLAPEPVDGAAESGLDPEQWAGAWRQHAPETQLWVAPGNHMTLLTAPHVNRLAEAITTLLKEKP